MTEKEKVYIYTRVSTAMQTEGYYLSGLLKCPSCGGPMYGIHNGRKKIKGTDKIYPLSYSYACRSGSLETGHKCPKPQNYSEPKLMDALTAIIKSLVNDKNFGHMVDDALGQKADISELEKEKARYQMEVERLERLAKQLSAEHDAIAPDAKAAKRKKADLKERWEKAMEDIDDIESHIADLDAQMEKIVAAEATKQQVYTILQSFDVLFDILDNTDKKLLIKELIEKIELYPREGRKLSGQWIKTIHFKFPMYYNDSNEPTCSLSFDKNGNFLPKQNTDESIVCLTKTY